MKRLNILLNLFHFLLILYAIIGKVEGIIGGDKAQPGLFKYQISLQTNNRHICGGAIVGKRHIITAAHCLINENEQFIDREYSIVAGVIKLTDVSGKIIVHVEKICIPKLFKRTNPNLKLTQYHSEGDIAVLKLETELALREPFSLNLPPQLSNKSYLKYANIYGTITGFGIETLIDNKQRAQGIMEFGTQLCNKLKHSESLILHRYSCRRTHPLITEKQICASMRQPFLMSPQGVCDGDSGGPLVLKEDNTLVGVLMNTTTHCNEIREPAMYTRVSSFITFIEKAMNDVESSDIRAAVYFNFNNNTRKLIEVYQII